MSAFSFDHSLNLAWVLLGAFLVMFMQVGFAMMETGFTRAKNAVNTMAMNMIVYPVGVLGFWLCGFGLMLGGVHDWPTLGATLAPAHEISLQIGGHAYGIIGAGKFALVSVANDPVNLAIFLFAAMFMDTAATIPTGAMAERWKFLSFCLFSFVISTIIYPIFANWTWGGGWLATLGKNFGLGHGHVDFAGSSVVHMTGGVVAFVGARMLGPRIGKFNSDGSPNPIPAHNIPMALLGTFILAFGWFGFNPGSTLAGTDTRIAVVAVNTMLASASGAGAATVYVWGRYGKPDPTWMANGMLAGLVAITAPCAFVSAPSAILIGAIAGVLVVLGALFVEGVLKVDDPVGAIAVHGINGAWGVLSLGLFANGVYGDGWNGVDGKVTGLLFGNPSQFVAECIGVIVNFAYVGGVTAISMLVLDKLVGNRVSREVELAGLDIPEHGIAGYYDGPRASLAPTSVTPPPPSAAPFPARSTRT